MKKILFLQIRDDTNGGIWFVNKTLATTFLERGFDVKILSIRKSFINIEDDTNLDMITINNKDKWEITHKRDIIINLKKGIISGLETFFKWINDNKKLKKDYKQMKEFIENYKPDYLIASHYQVFKGIPKSYLKKTINVHHTSYDILKVHTDNRKKLSKLKNKITFIWLSKNSCKKAINDGFKNSYYIYNPLKFETNDHSDVVNNKKLITIARLSEEKQIPLMIDMVQEIFNKKKYKDWTFEIYGYGPMEDIIKQKTNKQIIFKGVLKNPIDELLKSSIYLCASKFEGFGLSIVEGYECGLPAITFDFGEACQEIILDNKTGFIIKQDCINTYISKLEELMNNQEKLKEMSVEAKKYSANFHKDKIIDKWLEVFEKIDKGLM